jgi:hypothetical protein
VPVKCDIFMSSKTRKIAKKGQPCVNHPNNLKTEECERCHRFFCEECYVEEWHETFFQQFIGQKREIVKNIYCKPCRKRVVRIRMIAYIGILLLFFLPIILWLSVSIFS